MKKTTFERLSDFAKWASLFSGNIFVNISIYVDESGIHDKTGQLPGSEMVIVGGYGASIEDWSEICVRWQAVLKKYDDVPYFHYSELRDRKQRLNNQEWPYYGWNEKRCDEFLIELAKVTYKSNARFFGGFFRAKDAHAYYAKNPAISKKDPHKSCIDWFYGAFRRDMNLFWPTRRILSLFSLTRQTIPDGAKLLMKCIYSTKRPNLELKNLWVSVIKKTLSTFRYRLPISPFLGLDEKWRNVLSNRQTRQKIWTFCFLTSLFSAPYSYHLVAAKSALRAHSGFVMPDFLIAC